MNLVHEDYIDENNIDESKLPKEIKTKIATINNKLDEFETIEIDEGNKMYDEIMLLSEDIKNDLEKSKKVEDPKPSETDELGVQIDLELDKLFKSEKTSLTIDQIKSTSPKTYDSIFEEYNEGGENGVITSNYSLIENGEQVYLLKQA